MGLEASPVRATFMSNAHAGRHFLVSPQSVPLRRALFHVHRWVGLAIGVYVLLVSLSGGVIVYRGELDRVFATRTVVVRPRERRLSDAQLLAAARAAYPGVRFSAIQIHPPSAPDRPAEVWFFFGGRRVGPGRIKRLFDPYTGQDLGDPLGPEPAPLSWIARLHENLLSGSIGLALNGVAAMLLTVLCLTGAVIWWPGSARWRRSVALRRHVGWRRLTWDLHSVLGFWGLLAVLMWSLTGIYLAFPDAFVSLLKLLWVHGAPTAASRASGRAIDWLVPLHFARAFGPYVQACFAILALVPSALFVTGVLMWWNRVLRRPFGRVWHGDGRVRPVAAAGQAATPPARPG
ncbi:MAG TPA: PepSY-associated TM helix domain-containing protein [Steroidobacteraceae bacterium]|nr:PepSY-associated TM helix domain-containing protein [Steroidobacteraceae bacterium]